MTHFQQELQVYWKIASDPYDKPALNLFEGSSSASVSGYPHSRHSAFTCLERWLQD